jgi:hypothetical protein
MVSPRTPASGRLLRVFGTASVLAVTLTAARAEAAPIPVRFPEGLVHGFLSLRSVDGEILASGDQLQVARGDRIESRLVFHFKDGSSSDETVVFSQEKVFTMLSYRLIQRGPAFHGYLSVALDRPGGRYTVKSAPAGGGEPDEFSGTLELPPDVYNGMILLMLKNLRKDEAATVHMVAFAPKPSMIEVEMVSAAQEEVPVGIVVKTVTHYALKPKLGAVRKVFASLLGKLPPDVDAWILAEEVPAFMRYEGPLYANGPVWRIELVSPRWEK